MADGKKWCCRPFSGRVPASHQKKEEKEFANLASRVGGEEEETTGRKKKRSSSIVHAAATQREGPPLFPWRRKERGEKEKRKHSEVSA